MQISQQNLDDKLLASRALDTVMRSQTRSYCSFLGFLNEHEQQIVKNCISGYDNCIFYGGYEDAQRVMLGAGVYDLSEFPITPLEFVYRHQDSLSHRDFLGSLMSLGLKRDVIGDILVSSGRTVIFVKSEISDYIISQVKKIGKVGVKVIVCDSSDLPVNNNFVIDNYTVSSLRLDVFVSAVCNISREKSFKLIKSEFVCIDHSLETNVSKQLSEGNTITIRKYGKFVFTKINGLSKKGKIRISVKRWK